MAVILQHGSTGTYCQNVVRDILDAYFYGKTVDDEGNLVMPEELAASSAVSDEEGDASSNASGETSSQGTASAE